MHMHSQIFPFRMVDKRFRLENLFSLAGMQRMFEDRTRFPRLRSSTYFNSLNSMICPRPVPGYASSPELVPNLTALMHSKVFTALD